MIGALQITFRIPSQLQTDMQHAPEVLARHLDRGAGRAALELSRGMRRQAPKAHSLLTNSISVVNVGVGIRSIVAAADYARMVEEGTGPGGFPPIPTMIDWIRVKRIKPNDPNLTEEDLAFMIARSIARKGTPGAPYAAPVVEQLTPRVREIINAALADGLREARLA